MHKGIRGTGIWRDVAYQFQTYFSHVEIIVEDGHCPLTNSDLNRMREDIREDRRFIGNPPILFKDRFTDD